jgi:hypothetical protein
MRSSAGYCPPPVATDSVVDRPAQARSRPPGSTRTTDTTMSRLTVTVAATIHTHRRRRVDRHRRIGEENRRRCRLGAALLDLRYDMSVATDLTLGEQTPTAGSGHRGGDSARA